MAIDISNKEEKQIALTGVEIESALLKANDIQSSASEIDDMVTNGATQSDLDALTLSSGNLTPEQIATLASINGVDLFTQEEQNLFIDKLSDVAIRSRNLIDNSTYVNYRHAYNSNTFIQNGKSAIVSVTGGLQYWIIRPSILISGIPRTEEYEAAAAIFTDGVNGSGNVILPNGEDKLAFPYTLKSGRFTVPTNAKSLILTVNTPTLGDIEDVYLASAEVGNNFTYDSQPYYLSNDFVPSEIQYTTIKNQKAGTYATLNYSKVLKTNRIYVEEGSLLWVKTGFTSTLYGTLVAFYDDDGVLIREIRAENGNIRNLNNTISLVDYIVQDDFIYLNLRLVGVKSIVVASFTNAIDYVFPELFGSLVQQENEINNTSILWANPKQIGYNNERVSHYFFCKTQSGKTIRHTLTSVGVESNMYGFGTSYVTNPAPEDYTAESTQVLNVANIAEYYSFRSTLNGITDTNFTGHANTLQLKNIEFYGDNKLIDMTIEKDIRRYETIKVIQYSDLFHIANTTLTKVAEAELALVINCDGTFDYFNKVNFTENLTLNTYIPMMQFYRNSAKSDSVICFDKIKYGNDFLLTNVASNSVRQYYENNTSSSLTLLDSEKGVKVELTANVFENNHPIVVSDKLSFQTETAFSKLYFFFGVGERFVDDYYLVNVNIKFF